MTDESISARTSHELQMELEKSRESAARLLDSLAHKVGGSRALHSAAIGVKRASHYVHAHSVRGVATAIERVVRTRPAAAIVVAIAAGFLVGRAFRPR
jgi:ElaB/YqjD/DUF883 family membrane-anchored ribosome-binding protein